MWRQITALCQFLVTLTTYKTSLKSQPTIRTPINLLASTLCTQTNRFLCNRNRLVWFSQDDSHGYESKATLEKPQPRAVIYGDYKYFENCRFSAYLLSELSEANIEVNEEGLSDFLNTYKRVLDVYAPLKQKYARGSHMPLNRALSKKVMTRTRLRKNFFKG